MAKIIPFRAVRPSPDKVALVTCRTYDDYSPAELAAWLNFNPYSFLHVLNPAYVNTQKIGLEKRFKGVAHRFADFKNDKVFVQDENPNFYIYEIQNKNHTFCGIVAGTSVQDYQNNVIKKHENTLQYRVELFKDYLHQTAFNTEPVLLTYPDSASLTTWINLKKKNKALYDFTTTNKERHTLWKIDTESDIAFVQTHFENIPNLYIADGHHRSASANLLWEENKHLNNPNLNYFMSFLIPESTIKIHEYNRIIRDLNGFSKNEFLEKLKHYFDIENKGLVLWKPEQKFEFGMYLDGSFYKMTLKNNHQNFGNILAALDAEILYQKVLLPLLGIEDLRNDDRIEYIAGNQPITNIKEIIDEGEFEVAFMLYPSNFEEIKALADHHLIMPPKSTYIEPKFRSGLLVYEL